jgi:hypothetical protein
VEVKFDDVLSGEAVRAGERQNNRFIKNQITGT